MTYHVKLLLRGGLQDPKPTGQNTIGILHNPSLMVGMVDVHPLSHVQSPVGEWLYGEDFIVQDVIVHFGSVIQPVTTLGESNNSILYLSPGIILLENLTIKT